MVKVKLNGDLGASLEDLVGSFDGAIASNGGAGITVTAGYPFGVFLTGPSLTVPTSGPHFLSGTVSRVTLTELVMMDAGEPMRFVDRVTISDIAAPAASLFDLLGRTATTATGRFDAKAFQGLLDEDATIIGGRQADVVGPGRWMALEGSDTIRTGDGADRVDAGLGSDLVAGEGGDDRLVGGQGADELRGGDGHDVLSGARGDDLLLGGKGADVFVFAQGGGRDEIADFDPRADRIDLGDGLRYEVSDAGRGALVVFAGGSVLLPGVEAAAVTDDVFV